MAYNEQNYKRLNKTQKQREEKIKFYLGNFFFDIGSRKVFGKISESLSKRWGIQDGLCGEQ